MTADLAFASPRKLPRAADLRGRVVVLDIAFASEGIGRGFQPVTGRFIQELGARLARWVDHHDHPFHEAFRSDRRFLLFSKAQHGACPEILTPEIVAETGPIDTILCHFDLDGLYAAAKWVKGGIEPYPGADDDARAVDTRTGEPSAQALRIDKALRAHWNDDVLKRRIVQFLVGGLRPGTELESIVEAAADFDAMAEESLRWAERFEVRGGVAVVRLSSDAKRLDKTELLLLGQKLAEVAVVVDGGNATIAADFDSGIDFLRLLGIGGGMPTRVSIPEKRLESALAAIAEALASRGGSEREGS